MGELRPSCGKSIPGPDDMVSEYLSLAMGSKPHTRVALECAQERRDQSWRLSGSGDGVFKEGFDFRGGDLFAVDVEVVGGFDADADGVAVDLDDGDADVLTDLEPLTELPAQNQPGSLLLD